MATIRNIILDFGGVLLDLDERATYDAFVRLGLRSLPEAFTPVNHDFQRGCISTDDFVAALLQYLPAGTTAGQVRDAWCAMLGTVPQERLDLLRQWKSRYRLFLLSNTDDIHIGRLRATWPAFGEFEKCFDGVYYSQRTGFRKPEREIFERVIRENGINPAETLFVDDLRENAEAAVQVGMRYFWLDLSRDSLAVLPEILARLDV